MTKKYGPFKRDYNFKASIDDFILDTNEKVEALVKMSMQDVVNEAQKTKAKGGNLPVDTGFLRLSGTLSLNGMPSGPARGESKEKDFYTSPDDYSTSAAMVELSKVQLGNTLYFGWTANYARYQEVWNGFLESAVQKWPAIVKKRSAELKGLLK